MKTRRTLFSLSVLGIIAMGNSLLYAQNISGKITDLSGASISGALIIKETNSNIYAMSSSTGTFTIPGNVGDKLRVAALHYETRINVIATIASNLNIQLDKDALEKAGDIYHINFDHIRPGTRITKNEILDAFPVPSSKGFYEGTELSDRASIDRNISRDPSGQSLKVRFPKGEVVTNGSGVDLRIPLKGDFKSNDYKADELYLSYWMKFADNFDINKCGGKLPSLGGSSFALRENLWKGRIMWARGGAIRFYMELPHSEDGLGDERWWGSNTNNNASLCETAYTPHLAAKIWHNIELRYKMDNGKASDGGLFEGWVDGKKFSVPSSAFGYYRPVGGGIDDLTINAILISTFHGGSADADWWPDKDEYIWFDEFRVSKTRINDWAKYQTTTSVEEFETTDRFTAFPNPSTDVFQLSKKVTWELISMTGQILKTGEGEKVNLVDFASGVYILKTNEGSLKLEKK